MKKFLVILAVLFGVPCGAGATLMCQSGFFSVNSQDGNKNAACYIGDGFVELMVHFDTGVNTASGYEDVKTYLESIVDDIGHVVIIGSADMQPYKTENSWKQNATLSQERAKWVIDNVLPSAIRGSCNFDGKETELCSVYATGNANDYVHSNGAADGNLDERVAHIYVIWRLPNCYSVKNNKTEIEAAFEKCNISIDDDSELAKCLDGKPLTPTDDEKLLAFLFESIQKCSALKGIVGADIAAANISKFLGSLDLTVWRDTEGNFNTARLASDSIAAVVLGTTGGIITSKLVKKNQIKKGFEDLNCSIRGQRVASYGDEFSVGLQ